MASRSSACARAGLRSLPAPDGRHPVLPLLSYSSTSGASPAPRARSQRSLARGSWGGSTSSALSPGCPAKLPSCVATLPALPAAPAHRASLFPPGHSTLLPFCTQCEPFSRPAADKVSSAVALPLCELLSLGLGVEGDRQPVRTGGSRRPRGCQRLHCLLSPPLRWRVWEVGSWSGLQGGGVTWGGSLCPFSAAREALSCTSSEPPLPRPVPPVRPLALGSLLRGAGWQEHPG